MIPIICPIIFIKIWIYVNILILRTLYYLRVNSIIEPFIFESKIRTNWKYDWTLLTLIYLNNVPGTTRSRARARSLAYYRKKSRRINSKSCSGGVTKQDRQAACTGAHNIVIRPTPAWLQAATERPFKPRSQEETSQSTPTGLRRMIAIYFDLDPLFYGLDATWTRILTSVNLVSLTSRTVYGTRFLSIGSQNIRSR